MKRTTLRTSAIALGVAAALPATAQEWNLAWGGFMNQHVVFGSTDIKTTVNVNDLSLTVAGDRRASGSRTGMPSEAQSYKTTLQIVSELPDDADEENTITLTAEIANGENVTMAMVNDAVITAINALSIGDDDITVTDGSTPEDIIYLLVGETDVGDNGEVDNTNTDVNSGTGYVALHQQVADTNKAVDMSGSGQRRNTEVHFKPSVTLENGITFAAQIEFEGDSAAGVDRSYMDISSDSLGMIRIGSHPSMGYGMIVAAPGVGLGINSGAHPNFIPVGSQTGAAYSSNNEVGGNWEAMRVSYMTPSLGGLTIGVSYAADGRGGGNSANHTGYLKEAETKGDLSDIMDIGAKFTQSLGEMNVTLAARYGTAQLEGYDKKPRETAVGAQVGFGAFTVGGAYADSQRPAGKDSSGWSLGASYAMDAWTFGIETYQGEYDNGDDHSVSKIAASRNLGPGVAWDIYAITAESTTTQGSLTVGARDPKPGDEGAAGIKLHSTGTTEGSGTIFGTAIKLSF